MAFGSKTTLSIGLATLWIGAAAAVEPGIFALRDLAHEARPASVEAVYHGVPVHWPTSTLEISYEGLAAGADSNLWFWIETLGKGSLSVDGEETPDRRWLENPDLSDFVDTWEWLRFAVKAPRGESGSLRVRASPWGDVFLGRAFFTAEDDATPPSLSALQLSEKTQLFQGRALYPDAGLSWGAAYIRITKADGESVETSVVNRSGHYSALVPRENELHAHLLDRRGRILTEQTPISFSETGVPFTPVGETERLLWLGEKDSGLLLRTSGWGRLPDLSERLWLFRFLDKVGERTPFHRLVEQESQDRRPVVVDVVFEDADLQRRDRDFIFADFLNRISIEGAPQPVRRILAAEGRVVGKAFTLASEWRDRVDGVIAWGGEPGEAVPSNLSDCPVGLLGDRTALEGMREWIASCNAIQNPLLVASYWSDPDSQTVATDIAEAIDWVHLPTLGKTDRALDHSAYLSATGRFQWLWISGISPPGALARVRAEWKPTGVVNLAVSNADRIRVHLNCGLERAGRQITLSLETLTLPVTLGPRFDAIEFRRRSDSLWTPRFVEFEAPLEARPVAQIPNPGFEAGEELKTFARFVRDRLNCDCAWGFLLTESFPEGSLSELELCNKVAPDPYVKVQWPFREIETFHDWRRSQPALSLDLVGYRPGVAESVGEATSGALICAVARSELLSYFMEHPEVEFEFEPLQVTRRELVGAFLTRQVAP